MPASRAPALGEPSRGLSRRQPRDGSHWDGAHAPRRRGGGEASLIGSPVQRERPAGIGGGAPQSTLEPVRDLTGERIANKYESLAAHQFQQRQQYAGYEQLV